jgi:hypothetical protein
MVEMAKESSSGRAGVRVQGVLPAEVYQRFKQVLKIERRKASESLKPEPSESSILAMLVARGIISFFAEER